MKTINVKARLIAIVAVIFMVGTVLPGVAQNATEIEVVPYLGKKLWLNAKGLDKAQQFQVKIQTEQGVLLFSETFKNQNEYRKVLDFSLAKVGDYYVDIVNDFGLVRKVITISEEKLVENDFGFSTMETVALSKQVQKMADNKVAIKLENHLETPLSLRIIDEKGNVLHEESGITGDTFAKLYDLSQLDKGYYSMTFSTKNYTSYYSVNLGK